MTTPKDSGGEVQETGGHRPEWYEIVWNERAARRGLLTFVITVLGLVVYLAVTGRGDLATGLLAFGLFLAAIRAWREVRSLWRWVLRRLAAVGDDA